MTLHMTLHTPSPLLTASRGVCCAHARSNDVRYCSEDAFFLNDALQSLEATPDLALFDTPLGPLNGADCGLGSPLDAKTPVAGKYTL